MTAALKWPTALAVVALGGCIRQPEEYSATIRRTSHGIPHVVAEDLGSLGFGQGYAFAEDHACTLLDQVMKVRSERARWLGRGEDDEYINSDFAYLHLGIYQAAEADFGDQPEEVQELVKGYAAGFDAWLDQVGSDGLSGHCAGEPWVRPISEVDLFAYYLDLSILASGRQLLEAIATAQPPGNRQLLGPSLSDLALTGEDGPGSNGWGIGKEMSESGGGLLLANPHFPWEGELKLWESQLTIPGELDVYGVGLMGVPGVLIGFNENVAWTHTVSNGKRMTMYQLTLESDDPTQYVYDGETRALASADYAVEVLQDDGSVGEVERTLWRSHYGPVLNVDPFGWSTETAFSYRDANIGNRSLVPQFLAMNRAEDFAAFKNAHREHGGIPWVNTMAVSPDGRAWYVDSAPTPNLREETVTTWLDEREDGFFAKAFWKSDAVLLDGSTSRDEWVEEDGAREPGLIPFDRLPQLERQDFIFNANDSHWLTNPAEPLEGYSVLHGEERTPRTPRTRMNATILTEGSAGHAGDDGRFSLVELQEAALSNRTMMGELLRDAVVARCTDVDSYDGVTLTDACALLESWDLRYDLGSIGAVVWREFLGDFAFEVFLDEGVVFAEPFDADDPIDTPRALTPAPAPDDDRTLQALAAGVTRLNDVGLALDAPLRDVQFTRKNEEAIPMHGGNRHEGTTNLIVYSVFKSTLDPEMSRGEVINADTDLTDEGYVVNYGTSFIMTLMFGDDGPEASAFLTYSQSADPESRYHSDQTELFSQKQWRPCLFDEAEVLDDTLETYTVNGRRE